MGCEGFARHGAPQNATPQHAIQHTVCLGAAAVAHLPQRAVGIRHLDKEPKAAPLVVGSEVEQWEAAAGCGRQGGDDRASRQVPRTDGGRQSRQLGRDSAWCMAHVSQLELHIGGCSHQWAPRKR